MQSVQPPAPKTGKALRSAEAWRVLDKREWIEYPSDDAQLERLLSGDKLPRSERKVKRVKAGEIAKDIPAKSVPGLIAAGWICKADGPDDPYAASKGKAE
ncbi:MAG: hypothetical protein IPK80_02930 [Nannocystis sp.]|nr:hypothetical protein [Nannocystis sp.]